MVVDYLFMFLTVIVAASSFYFIVSPFFENKFAPIVEDEGISMKEQLYKSLNDLEMDFHMGKLSAEDYEQSRQQYKVEIVNELEKDHEETRDTIDIELWEQIERLRSEKS